jgi:hypothetical protein
MTTMSKSTRSTRKPIRSFATAATLLFSLFLTVLLSAGTAGAATNCNQVQSQTILPPDRAGMTTYVTLQEQCGTPVVPQFFKCKAHFTITPGMTVQDKCQALVDAITNKVNDPLNQCPQHGFSIAANNCGLAPLGLAQFTLTGGNCTSATPNVSLAISNDPSIGNQESATGRPLPDYEAELITPVCVTTPGPAAPAPPPTPAMAEFLFRGPASGASFIAGVQPAVSIVADASNVGGALTTATVATTPGMTTSTIAAGLTQQLVAAGLNCTLATAPFDGVVCTQPDMVNTISFAAHTTDATVGIGNAAASAALLPTAFSGTAGTPVPAMPSWSMWLTVAVLLAGSWVAMRRQRRDTLAHG